MSKLWGGRFTGKLDPRIEALNRSFPFDQRLWREDIDGSLAWARALQRAGVLTKSELKAVTRGLRAVHDEFGAGKFKERPSDEDIHTAVERRLTELAGEVGKKLPTGRSRNDLVATDFLLWLRAACDQLHGELRDVQRALLDAADGAGEIVIPAYTHLQRAQPVLLAHHLLAYVEMLERDGGRIEDLKARADVLPLGCGACTGTSVAIDRRELARELGFKRVAENSLDAVGSRDAALEFLGAATIAMTHLSRLGEEVVLWVSAEFKFAELGDNVSTGSSLLPQKRNPDGAELARGKTGRVLGDFVTLATAIKGIPLAYNKDLQEDKEAAFDAFDTLCGTAAAMAATVAGLEFRADRCAQALTSGHLLAVDVADYLVAKGVPFRTAHGLVGELVREAEKRGCDITELNLAAMQSIEPRIQKDVHKFLTIDAATKRRSAIGGTAPRRVRAQLAKWKRRFE